MKKYILVYGIICGLIGICSLTLAIALSTDEGNATSQVFGYLVMFVALSMIFLGIKKYRDAEQGGVIRFSKALMMGLAITAIAGVIYAVVWEIYLNVTDYAFIGEYSAQYIEAKKAAGLTGAELAAVEAKMEKMIERYGNPLFRLPMTFIEIFPVGALISLISAAILRRPKKRQTAG